MDEIDTLDITVEELLKQIKITWIASSISYDYEYRIDFEEEVEADSKEVVIDLMIDKFISKNQSHAEEICLSRRFELRIPLQDSDDIWQFKDFTYVERMGSISKSEIKKYPSWQTKVVKAAEEKAAAEKLKKEEEQKRWAEESRRRDLATYERIKKEMEAKNGLI